MKDKIPRMDYRQYRAACRLVHECCNYDNGNCIATCSMDIEKMLSFFDGYLAVYDNCFRAYNSVFGLAYI